MPPATWGRTRRKCWDLFPAAPPSSDGQRCRGCRLRTAKKKRGPTPSEFDALPLHRRSNRRITRGSPTGRRGYDQTTTEVSKPRKSTGPTLCSVRRNHPLTKRERNQVDGRNTYESSPSRQNIAAVRQPRKKERSHPLPS